MYIYINILYIYIYIDRYVYIDGFPVGFPFQLFYTGIVFSFSLKNNESSYLMVSWWFGLVVLVLLSGSSLLDPTLRP